MHPLLIILLFSLTKITFKPAIQIIFMPFFAGSLSDDEQENDNEPLPDFLLPNYSHNNERSPHLNRTRASSPPKIIKSSLKNFSGLEGTHLPSQDSVDYGILNVKNRPQGALSTSESVDPSSPCPETPALVAESPVAATPTPSIVSISQENRVKIQVPGLPTSKTSKTSLLDH